MLESWWVDGASVASLPRVMAKPGSVVYGPLADSQTAPDVVLLRVNGLGLMTLKMPCLSSGSKASRSATSWPSRRNRGQSRQALAVHSAVPAQA